METFNLVEYWREQVKIIQGHRVTLSLNSMVLAGVKVIEVRINGEKKLLPITLVTDVETITIDKAHPWRVDTIL